MDMGDHIFFAANSLKAIGAAALGSTPLIGLMVVLIFLVLAFGAVVKLLIQWHPPANYCSLALRARTRSPKLLREAAPYYCAVCLHDITDGERYRKLPKCHHLFHARCIDPWFQLRATCPLCRSVVSGVYACQTNGRSTPGHVILHVLSISQRVLRKGLTSES